MESLPCPMTDAGRAEYFKFKESLKSDFAKKEFVIGVKETFDMDYSIDHQMLNAGDIIRVIKQFSGTSY